MSKMRTIMLCLLVVSTTGAITSTPASAAHNFKIEGKEVKAAEKEEIEGITQQQEPQKIEANLGGIHFIIECQEAYAKLGAANTIEEKGKSAFELEFKTWCFAGQISKGVVERLSECKIKEPINAKGEDVLTGQGGFSQNQFKEKGGVEFTTVTLTGAGCALATKEFPVKGSFTCSLPKAPAELVVHEVKCAQEGSELKICTGPTENAYLYSTLLFKTKKAEKWSAE